MAIDLAKVIDPCEVRSLKALCSRLERYSEFRLPYGVKVGRRTPVKYNTPECLHVVLLFFDNVNDIFEFGNIA